MFKTHSTAFSFILYTVFGVATLQGECDANCASDAYDLSHAADAITQRRRRRKGEELSEETNSENKNSIHMDLEKSDNLKRLPNGKAYVIPGYK